MKNGRKKFNQNINMRLSTRRQQFHLKRNIRSLFHGTEAHRKAVKVNIRRLSEAQEQRAAVFIRDRAEILHREVKAKHQRKQRQKNIQLKEPLLKRQQQRNTIRMMRQIITIPKIFIMITTTISLITKKRKIISTNTIK